MNSLQRELERKIKEEVRKSQIDISALPTDSVILRALKENVNNPKIAYLYSAGGPPCCPEVEYYTILAEENKLISIEIDHDGPSSAPLIEVQNVHEYRKGLRGRESNVKIKMAIELMKEELEVLIC